MMPEFLAAWLDTNDIFTAMTIMEYWDGMVTTVQLVFLSLIIGLMCAIPLAILRTVKNPFVSGPVWLYTYIFRGTPLPWWQRVCPFPAPPRKKDRARDTDRDIAQWYR